MNLLQIEDLADDFNPFSALLEIGGEGHIIAPVEKLARLSGQRPVVEGDLHEYFGVPRQVTLGDIKKAYMVLSFDACHEVLANPADFSNAIYETHLGLTFGKSITTMDAPLHGKYRRLFQSAFTPKMMGALRQRFEKVVNDLIGAFCHKGTADLVSEFALHFPFSFICDLMDLPAGDRPLFHKLATAQSVITFDLKHGKEASEKLGRYLTGLIAERRQLKSDTDFISVIANSEVENECLPDDVVLAFFRQLMNAGGDTSYHSFSNTLAALFTHPDQLEAIHRNRSLVPQAIEEGLRWGGPFTTLDRITTRNLTLHDVHMEKGSVVRVCTSAANWDRVIWPNPDKFDIFREQKRHFAFGYGSHVCIGQHLARMELQTALNTLLDRLPNLRLNSDAPPPVIRGLTFRGADAIHVRWDLPGVSRETNTPMPVDSRTW